MPEFNFENIENILTEHLGGKYPVSKVQDFLLDENCGDHLRRLILTVKGKKAIGKDEVEILAVAKLLGSRRDIPVEKTAMKKEIDFYKTVLPKLQDFQTQNMFREVFSAVPEYIGSRLNLNGSREIDQDAALLLQNLGESGFVQADPKEGFNFEITKLILEKIAELHAIPLVMKYIKPMEFKRQVKDKSIDISQPDRFQTDILKHAEDSFWEKLYENDGCLPYIKKLKTVLKSHPPPFIIDPKEPFATVIHNDLWAKNIFIQYRKDIPVNIALIDFQEYVYGSPAADVLNLLLTSTEYSVLDQNFYELLKYYHCSLVENLKKYKVDLEPFVWNKFFQEVKDAAVPALLKAIFFLLNVVYVDETLNSLSLGAKQRIWTIVQQAGSSLSL